MRRMRVVGLALLALMAGAALMASSASAQINIETPIEIIHKGGQLTKESINTVIQTASGNLECEEMEMESELETNEEKKVKAHVTSWTAIGNFDEVPGACKTSSFGPAIISVVHLPFETVISEKGTVELKGKKIALQATFLALEGPNNKCTLEASKLKATFTPGTTTPAPMELSFSNQKMKLNKKAAGTADACPKEGQLSGTFNVTSGGEQVQTTVFKLKK